VSTTTMADCCFMRDSRSESASERWLRRVRPMGLRRGGFDSESATMTSECADEFGLVRSESKKIPTRLNLFVFIAFLNRSCRAEKECTLSLLERTKIDGAKNRRSFTSFMYKNANKFSKPIWQIKSGRQKIQVASTSYHRVPRG